MAEKPTEACVCELGECEGSGAEPWYGERALLSSAEAELQLLLQRSQRLRQLSVVYLE